MWADNFSKTHPNRSKLAQKIVIDGVVYSQKNVHFRLDRNSITNYSDYIIFITCFLLQNNSTTIFYIFSHSILKFSQPTTNSLGNILKCPIKS